MTIHRAGPVLIDTKMTIHRAGPVSRLSKMTIHRAGPVYSLVLYVICIYAKYANPNPSIYQVKLENYVINVKNRSHRVKTSQNLFYVPNLRARFLPGMRVFRFGIKDTIGLFGSYKTERVVES